MVTGEVARRDLLAMFNIPVGCLWQHIRVKKRPYCRREGSWRASDKGEGSWRPPGGGQGEGSRRVSGWG